MLWWLVYFVLLSKNKLWTLEPFNNLSTPPFKVLRAFTDSPVQQTLPTKKDTVNCNRLNQSKPPKAIVGTFPFSVGRGFALYHHNSFGAVQGVETDSGRFQTNFLNYSQRNSRISDRSSQRLQLLYLTESDRKGRYVFYWEGWVGVFWTFFAKKVVALPLPRMD